jgi:K+-sensing histidine kinase KdpD
MSISQSRVIAIRLYAGTIAVTLVALAISVLTQRISATPSYVAFVAAVALAARFGGKGPAITAGLLSLALIDYFMIPPIGVIDFRQPEQGVNTIVFGAVAFIIISMTTRLRHAEREARERAESLAQVNVELQDRMEEVQALDESLHDANEYLTDARDAAARLANGALRLQAGTESLSKAATVADVGRVALDAITKLTSMSQGALYLLRGDTLTLLTTAGDRTDNLKNIDVAHRSVDDAPDPMTLALLSGEPVWIDSRAELPLRFADIARAWPHHVSLPLISGDSRVGVLSVSSTSPTASSDAERSLLRLYAHAVAGALVRAQRYDAERGGREAAETLARAREEVLAVVAHDLRNPLNIVGASTEMLAELEDDPAKRREMIEVSRRALKRMNGLISDLLDITRLEAGHLTLETASVAVTDLFTQVREAWTTVLATRKLTLRVVHPRQDLRIEADAGRIAQVLDNLIGNAGKFTPPGGQVCVRAEHDASGQVRFLVSDTGPGIAPEEAARLFDRFWQARRSDRRGIGLGLTICKGIVEAHGGRIWCESTPGVGTKFFFTIPSAAVPVHRISA